MRLPIFSLGLAITSTNLYTYAQPVGNNTSLDTKVYTEGQDGGDGGTEFANASKAPNSSQTKPDPSDGYKGVTLLEGDVGGIDRQSPEMAADVCGSPGHGQVASATWSKEMWDHYDMAGYVQEVVKWYQDHNWDAGQDGNGVNNIQEMFLRQAGNEGVGQCDEISNPGCVDTGMDFNLCKEHPAAHFAWIAIVHFANFMNKFYETVQNSNALLTDTAPKIVDNFFTARNDPSDLAVPFGIVNAIGSIISVVWPGGGYVSGAGGIAAGIVTQIGLDNPDSVDQWKDVLAVIGDLFKNIMEALEDFFDWNLKTLPDMITNLLGNLIFFGPPSKIGKSSKTSWADDPNGLPQILSTGEFAVTPSVGSFNDGVLKAFATAAINTMWLQDKVLILKMSDTAYDEGDGEACKAYEDQTICRDGIAYIFVRWALSGGVATWGINSDARFDDDSWNVFGAYDRGKAGDGTKNANHLKDYSLTLDEILDSAIETQKKHGFLYKDQNKDTLKLLQDNPGDIKATDLQAWNIPICDIDAGLAAKGDKHLKGVPSATDSYGTAADNKLAQWGVSTCLAIEDWPKDQYGIGDRFGG